MRRCLLWIALLVLLIAKGARSVPKPQENVPQPETDVCEKGGINDCKAKKQQCVINENDETKYDCKDCPEDLKLNDDGKCVDIDACKDLNGKYECLQKNEMCENDKNNKTRYHCARCLENQKLTVDGICVDKTGCEIEGTRKCLAQKSRCEVKPENNTDYECTPCPEDQKVNEVGECIDKDICEKEGLKDCLDQNQHCVVDAIDKTKYDCENCAEGQKVNNDGECVDKDVCEKGGLEECKAKNQQCVVNENDETKFECKDCPEDLKLNDGKCVDVCEDRGKNICQKQGKSCQVKAFDKSQYDCVDCPEGQKTNDDGNCIDKNICEREGTEQCSKQNSRCEVKPDKNTEYECKPCFQDEKVNEKGECTATCSYDDDCNNGGTCQGEEVRFCKCPEGTSGGSCKEVNDCVTGKYKGCKGPRGQCYYEDRDKKAVCACGEGKELDEAMNFCRATCKSSDDCNGGECKGSTDKMFCFCKQGLEGDMCEIVSGCKELAETCESADAKCVYDETESNKATCKCNKDTYFDYDKMTKNCIANWCKENPCSQDSVCLFFTPDEVPVCKCNDSSKFYDYADKKCKAYDKCALLKPCPENQICKDGKCTCRPGFKQENEECKPDLCNPNPCFTGGKCTIEEGAAKCKCDEGYYYNGDKCVDGSCVSKNFKETCKTCPSPFQYDTEKKMCALKEEKNLCDDDCGFGYCVKENDMNTCKCLNNMNLENGKCVLKKEVCNPFELAEDKSKCNCTDLYKQAEDGITCELKSCADRTGEEKCENTGRTCKMNWSGNQTGTECLCPTGYVFDADSNKCTDFCQLESSRIACQKDGKFCYISPKSLKGEETDCQCPPMLGYYPYEGCQILANNTFEITGIPVYKKKYVSDGKVDYVLLNSDLINAVKTMVDSIDYGYLDEYKEDNEVLVSSMWVQLKEDATEVDVLELNRFSQQTSEAECAKDECEEGIVLLPPSLPLVQKKMISLKSSNMAFSKTKTRKLLCGEHAEFDDVEMKCFCPSGYSEVSFGMKNVVGINTVRCEDIDECAEGIHNCSSNTTCVNTVGDYYCRCKTNFKKAGQKIPDNSVTDKNPCIDMCSNSPCDKGTCFVEEVDKEKKVNFFNCRCDPGFSGSLCDKEDLHLASARSNVTVIGFVMGALICLTLVGCFLYVRRVRKNRHSETFTQVPQEDPAEMNNRLRIRGATDRDFGPCSSL